MKFKIPFIITKKIRSYEMGLYFRDREFRRLLSPGRHWFIAWPGKVRIESSSRRTAWIHDEQLDMIVRSGQLAGQAEVIDLQDHQRALVWLDGRFQHVLPPGLYAYWTGLREMRVEIVDARQVRFDHPQLKAIVQSSQSHFVLEQVTVQPHHVGVLFIDGRLQEVLPPGCHAFWKNMGQVRLVQVDLREVMLDITGQDIMTADKVTLRMNAVVTYRVKDARQALSTAEDYRQALYRETQLALRAIVGARELDAFLTDKDQVAEQLTEMIQTRTRQLGLELIGVGIRDLILPGEMKELMNRVTEAKKAAEANLIARREETAAMRSQANTAKLLADNPTLMRLRELEILEKIASNSRLNIRLDSGGLTEQVTNVL